MQEKATEPGRVRRLWQLIRHDFGRFRGSLSRAFRLRWSALLLLALVLLGALLIRLPAMDRGTQAGFSELYVDEFKILSNTMKVLQGQPLLAHWPYGLYHWLSPQFGLASVATMPTLSEVLGRPANFKEAVYALYRVEKRWLIGLLRYNALFFGLVLIVVIFGLARQVAGDYPAIAAAALAAASPVLVAYSRTLYYDLPMTFWFWGTVAVLAWAARNRSLVGIYFAAALLAWTVTTKQNAVTLAPLWAFAAIYVIVQREGVPWYKAPFSIHLVLAGLLGLVVFLVNYPTLLNFASLEQLGFLSKNEHLALTESAGKPRLWTVWLTRYWPGQAHPAVLGVLVTGLILLPALSRDRLTAFFIVAATLLYYAIAGALGHLNLRSMMPMVPGLCIGIAGWWLLAQRCFGARLAPALAIGLTLLAMASLLSNSVRQTMLIALPDTITQAAGWMERNVPSMSKVARETYTPRLVNVPSGTLYERYAKARKVPAFDVQFMGSLGSKGPQFYRDEGYEYLIANDKVRRFAQVTLRRTGEEMTAYDKRAPHIGKSQRYAGVPLSEVLDNYEAIGREFEPLVTFSPNPPKNLDFVKTSYPWWTFGSFIHPGIWELWTNFDRYSLGDQVAIYRVK